MENSTETSNDLTLPPSLIVQSPGDTEEAVQKCLSEYNMYVDDLVDYYDEARHVNADQDPYTVQECVESFIVNPLPKPSHHLPSE